MSYPALQNPPLILWNIHLKLNLIENGWNRFHLEASEGVVGDGGEAYGKAAAARAASAAVQRVRK